MPSERVQRRIHRLLDDAEEAADQHDWRLVLDLTARVLEVDPQNEDALSFERMAEANLESRASGDDHFDQHERRHDELVDAVKNTHGCFPEYALQRARRTVAGCLIISVAIVAIIIGFGVAGVLFWPVLGIVPVIVLLAMWRRRRNRSQLND